ncbi:MAG: ATP-grasp domain-containing protein [Pseudomonadota bacterium]
MNIVYLSPHFPFHYHRFCRRLKQAGATVLGIGDALYDDLPVAVRDSLTEYYWVQDMHNYDALLRACGFFVHKYGKIDRFESLNEYWLDTEARIRDDFNIIGIRGRDIDGIRRKSRMKEKFREAGIPVARGRVVQTVEDARKLINETGYPVVAKPDAGVGALNTFRLDSDDDLTQFFDRKPSADYMMEAFVSGTIYSFDGLTDRDGNLVFYTAHAFSQGIMETVNEARHMYYYSLREIPSSLEAVGRRCVKAFEVRERFFHIEFFQTGDDSYTALEVNMRPPGGFTTDMFNYACDIDIYRVWAELLVHRRTELPYTRKYHCCYASRKNNQRYLHDHEDIMLRFSGFIVMAGSVPGVFSSALGDAGYIFRADKLSDIYEIIRFIHEAKIPSCQ